MPAVVLENIHKQYGEVEAAKNINLEIEKGEFVVLVGPSGCGKSTILRMIAGLEEISAGQLFMEEKLVNDVAPKDRGIAMVFQNYALYPHMNVYNNLAFGLKMRKFSKLEMEERIQKAAKILGLQDLLKRKPSQLSGGQRQRVALGRAIVRDPQLFLMDEPLSNLDAKLRVQMRAEISRLQKKLGVTMIYVTHDQTEAMTMGDRIVVMEDAEIQQVATPEEVYQQPANRFVAGFIGAPAMNFISGKIRKEGGCFYFLVEPGLKVELEAAQAKVLTEKGYNDKEIIFGIRPEHITMAETDTGINTIHAVVGLAENMGSEYYVYFNMAKQELIARLQLKVAPQVNDSITLALQAKEGHFFDVKTGEVIR